MGQGREGIGVFQCQRICWRNVVEGLILIASMASRARLVRIGSLVTAAEFRSCVKALGLEIPCDDTILRQAESPLAQPIPHVKINGKTIGNRLAVQPMEGWDGSPSGGITADVLRRWSRFGESGAKLIAGGEAMAVRMEGRANPNQLVISDETKGGLAQLRETLVEAHRRVHGSADDLVVGFQLTHSGRFCKPYDKSRLVPKVAYRHPILDRRFGITSNEQVITDDDVERLIHDFVRAARIAWDTGADFVDIKHCHGYLLHEFLSAYTRPGKYGGSFENRTRILRDIVAGIRADSNRIGLAVRLSAFDIVPFKPDPVHSLPGRPGTGVPEDYSDQLPYRYGFGVNPRNPIEPDLAETIRFVELCRELGIKLINLTAGSPYYNPHVQRPAAYPPSDGYQPPEDPLCGVARQIQATRRIKGAVPSDIIVLGSAYSYLQDFLPQVAQAVIRSGWVDSVGFGRMVLSYPTIFSDAMSKGKLVTKQICRTFSDCTTAPRSGLVSGCYPLDPYYAAKPDYQQLKALKAAAARP